MVIVACCLLDVLLLAAGIVLAMRAPRGLGALRELLWLAAFAFAVAVAFALPLRVLGGGFGVLRGFAHAAFCVILPVCAVRGVCIARPSPWLAAPLLLAFVVGEGCYVWARRVEPRRLEVTHERIVSERLAPAVRALGRPLRVACLADLQTDEIGAHEVAVFDELVAWRPDIVLLLGDYLQVDAERGAQLLPLLHEQLARVDAPHGMFAVDGDVDGALGGARGVFAGTAVRALVDEKVALPHLPIDVIGLSRAKSRAPFVDVGVVRQLAGERFPIVIGHAPDFMLSVLRDGYDPDALLVAGHTHGGQIQVPGFGPILTLSSVPRWLAGGGVFRRGDAWLVCSRGVGMERGNAPRIRFWCRPQLVLLELHDGSSLR